MAIFKSLKLTRTHLLALVGLVLAVGAVGVAFQDPLFRLGVKPPGRFQDAPAPERPDYSLPASWAMRPTTPPPGGWEKPWGVDVFFIHPTTAYAGDDWNAPIDDKTSSQRLAERILPNLAAPFAKAGPVYAPRYRQAALHSELNVGTSSDGALLVAYDDVLRAFDHYFANDNRGRAVVLVGVGQGGLHATRLLQDRFQDDPAKERLAAVYLIETAVPADLAGAAISQPVCMTHDDIHCIVAWKSLIDGNSAERKRFEDASAIWSGDGKLTSSKGRELLCVNPLLWNTSGDLAPRNDHKGGARVLGPEDLEPQILANTVSARCVDGALVVDRPTSPALQPSSDWGGRYKTPEYNLFYADLMFNAAERARAVSVWLDEFGRKPATPLPPPLALEDSPIHRPDGVIDPVR